MHVGVASSFVASQSGVSCPVSSVSFSMFPQSSVLLVSCLFSDGVWEKKLSVPAFN